jgi:DNA-binding beta-propeller fold protein YncE
MTPRTLLLPALLAAALALPACSDSAFTFTPGRTDTDNDPSDPGNGGADADDNEPPPEQEDDFLALPPSTSDVFVFVANPARNTVSRINVYTLDVRTADVGVDPRVVRVTPDYQWAAVFNRGDDTISVIEASTLAVRSVPVRKNFNHMVMSGDGKWVGAFFSRAAVRPSDPPPTAIQSFNEVSFVSIPSGVHHGMVVSYNPRDIKFSEDGRLAVVISDEHLAIVDLTADVLRPVLVPISDALEPPKAEEVVLSPDGQFAFVRQFGANEIVLVDLDARQTFGLPVGANPTDLDLSPDGRHAVVVSRNDNQLWIFDTEAPLHPPQVLDLPPELTAGSLVFSPEGDRALIFTTASPTRTFAIWNTLTDTVRVENLVKPVRAMAYTPTGDSVLVLHTRTNSPDQVPGSDFYNAWAISLLQVDDRTLLSNAIKLPAEPTGFANAADGLNGYFIMEGEPALVQIDYLTLLYEAIRLRSDPVYVGVLPVIDETDPQRPPAWVSQEHDLGRISFYHPDSRRLETITGFELNNKIEE